jgi:hypothetical protein
LGRRQSLHRVLQRQETFAGINGNANAKATTQEKAAAKTNNKRLLIMNGAVEEKFKLFFKN